jgi:hypothetical protein
MIMFPIENVGKKTQFSLALFDAVPSFVSYTRCVPRLCNFCPHTVFSSPHLLTMPLFCLIHFLPPAFSFFYTGPIFFPLAPNEDEWSEKKMEKVGVGKRTQGEG